MHSKRAETQSWGCFDFSMIKSWLAMRARQTPSSQHCSTCLLCHAVMKCILIESQLKWPRDSDWRVNMWQLWSFRESSVLIPDGGKRKRRKYFTPNIYTPLCWHFSDLSAANTVFPSYSSSPNILCEQIILLDMLAYLVSLFTLTTTPLCHLHTHSHPLFPFHRLQSEQSQPPTGCKL